MTLRNVPSSKKNFNFEGPDFHFDYRNLLAMHKMLNENKNCAHRLHVESRFYSARKSTSSYNWNTKLNLFL